MFTLHTNVNNKISIKLSNYECDRKYYSKKDW